MKRLDAMYEDTDRLHAALVAAGHHTLDDEGLCVTCAAAVEVWRADKRTQRTKQYRQRLARPAVEPAHVRAAWETACDRDDAREAAGLVTIPA